MLRLSREAGRVSNAFGQFASPTLPRGKRSGSHGGRSGGAEVGGDGDQSIFNGGEGSYRERRLGFLSIDHAASASVGD